MFFSFFYTCYQFNSFLGDFIGGQLSLSTLYVLSDGSVWILQWRYALGFALVCVFAIVMMMNPLVYLEEISVLKAGTIVFHCIY